MILKDQVDYFQNVHRILSSHLFSTEEEKKSFLDTVWGEVLQYIREDKTFLLNKDIALAIEHLIQHGMTIEQQLCVFTALSGHWYFLSERSTSSFLVESLVEQCEDENSLLSIVREIILEDPKLLLLWSKTGSFVLRTVIRKLHHFSSCCAETFSSPSEEHPIHVSKDAWTMCQEKMLLIYTKKGYVMYRHRYSSPVLILFLELADEHFSNRIAESMINWMCTAGSHTLTTLVCHPIACRVVEVVLRIRYEKLVFSLLRKENAPLPTTHKANTRGKPDLMILDPEKIIVLARNRTGMRFLAAVIREAPRNHRQDRQNNMEGGYSTHPFRTHFPCSFFSFARATSQTRYDHSSHEYPKKP